ncbi:MAG TPA: iduronate-2-sulfatase, partial [Planctomycetaceae bacterium]|nr:iduronate-2-sulfatase [Planctomycetaceae bacterium]
SLRTARYRYTEWGEQGVQGIELYDHQHDPNEMRNLAKLPEHSHLIDQLAQQLHKRIAVARKLPKIKGN